MIIVKVPRRTGEKSLENFVTPLLKKFKRNKKHRHIQLRGEVAYSKSAVYFIFPREAIELAFALSILFKCQKHGIPCEIAATRPINIEGIPSEIKEAAQTWSERKLLRRFYRLRDLRL